MSKISVRALGDACMDRVRDCGVDAYSACKVLHGYLAVRVGVDVVNAIRAGRVLSGKNKEAKVCE